MKMQDTNQDQDPSPSSSPDTAVYHEEALLLVPLVPRTPPPRLLALLLDRILD
jgi:hypothetical protein